LYYFLHDSIIEQNSQGSFVSLGRCEISTTAIDTEEHPGRVRTAGFGVEVRQYFGSAPRSRTFVNPQMIKELVAQLAHRLKPKLTQQIRALVTNEIRGELRR